MAAVLIILLSFQLKITCAEVYIFHRHMLDTFENNSLAQQLQLKTLSLEIYKMIYL